MEILPHVHGSGAPALQLAFVRISRSFAHLRGIAQFGDSLLGDCYPT